MIPGHMESYLLYLSCKGYEKDQREGTRDGPEGGDMGGARGRGREEKSDIL